LIVRSDWQTGYNIGIEIACSRSNGCPRDSAIRAFLNCETLGDTSRLGPRQCGLGCAVVIDHQVGWRRRRLVQRHGNKGGRDWQQRCTGVAKAQLTAEIATPRVKCSG
jgi:hypothetical protein